MRRRSDGQSLVEMAFILPILLITLFGIIEFGYLLYAYSTVSQAARNAAEAAAQLPPYQTWLTYQGSSSIPGGLTFESDDCVRGIYGAARSDQTLFTDVSNFLTISYPDDAPGNDTRNLDDRGPIQVTIAYPVQGITPLFSLLRFGNNGSFTLTVTQRRSLENLGVDPSKPGGVACSRDAADYAKLHP